MKRIFVYEYLSGGGDELDDAAGAGELLAMGRAMRDAIATDLLGGTGYDVSVAGGKHAPEVPPGAHAVAPRAGESAFDFVARQADAHALAWVVAPESGDLLALLQQRVEPRRWLGCEAPAVAVASRKRLTAAQLHAAGLATPFDFENAPETRRWVVKPDDGAGALATRLHGSAAAAAADWAARTRAGQPTAIEPWVEGEALSLSLLCRAQRCELLAINRQRIRADAGDGQLVAFEGVDVAALPLAGARADTLRQLAAQVHGALPGLRGFVGIDLVWHALRGPVVIEVNPRLTCAYVGLSQVLGRALAHEVIAAHEADWGGHGNAGR